MKHNDEKGEIQEEVYTKKENKKCSIIERRKAWKRRWK
jgi:hypothetical protein